MHLVFATSIVPHGSPATGYEIANAAIIDALRRAGVHVTVVGFAWPGKPPSDPEGTVVLGEVDVRTDSASTVQKLAWLAKAVAEGVTFSSVKLRTVGREQVLGALHSLGHVDGYVLNSVQFAGAFEGLFDDRPAIFVAHNVEHRSAEENADAARDLLQKFLYRREARLLEGLERRLCEHARFVFTLAEEDRDALGVGSPGKSAALPLVTPASAWRASGPRRLSYDATLIGTWTWRPNRIGLDWFLEEVVPLLPEEFTVAIAGSTPAGLASRHPGVSFVGRVDDAVRFVRSGRVVPLISRAGSGVQLKTIETFELGLPAVATTRSLRGIGRPPENCIVADNAVDFADALRGAARKVEDADPSRFRRDQRAALDRQVLLGLSAMGYREKVSA